MAIMDPRVGRLDGPLYIRCVCGYSATWPPKVAIARLGEWTKPTQVRDRLSCSACGARGPGKISIDGQMK